MIGRIRGYRLFFHPLARPISDVSSRERVRRVGSPKGGGNSARETRRSMFRGGCEGGRGGGGSEVRGVEEEVVEDEGTGREGEKTLRVEESRASRASRWKQAGWINFGATVPEADA